MKKLLFIFLTLTLSGCVDVQHYDNSTNQPSNREYVGTRANTTIESIKYKDHDYILVISSFGEGIGCSLVHDPDCKCFKK